MELMQRIAKKYDMVCLLHEKPFEGVNGSGKHNNWSLSTDTGINLLEPGETPYENAQFLLFLCAVIKAVDEYQDLLRISVASAGNDHRLGANEAPTAIVSMFLGEELTGIINAIDNDSAYDPKAKTLMKIGVNVLPHFPKDTTDRNRTSPFAFTGNKFEFRMLGSSLSIAGPNIFLNTAVAESLRQYADTLEKAADFNLALQMLIKDTIKQHKRIIFNGNGYDDAWVVEAEKRGLLNLKTTPDCMPYVLKEKNVKLLTTHNVLTEAELHSRYEISLESYCKVLNIEALTMLDMANKDILPAAAAYSKELSETALAKKNFLSSADCTYEEKAVEKLSCLTGSLYLRMEHLTKVHNEAKAISDIAEQSFFYKDQVLPAMEELRKAADELEGITAKSFWPFPSYGDILFSVR
jgi:glutamine synthetase